MIRYVFKDAPVAIKAAKDADPQKIGEALAAIAKEGGGRLKPAAVVNKAKDPEHVLHRHFEWDDAAAAHRYRIDQARSLISSIRVEELGATESQPAFLSVGDAAGVSYRSVQEVSTSASLQLRLLEAAERDLLAFQTRYRALASICEIVEQARQKIREKRSENETRAA